MGKLREITINNFSGGISCDSSEQDLTKCNLVKHFDIFTSKHKLIPYRDMEADESDGNGGIKANDLRQFQLGLDGKLYALGDNESSKTEIYSKANPTTGNWAAETTSTSTGNLIYGAFIEWQSNFYMFTETTNLSRWAIGGAFTNAVSSLTLSTITSVAQGVVGGDGNLYMFYNNKVVKVDSAGTATNDVFTAIPSDMRITSACRYGSYLAIGCAYGTASTSSPAGRSQVYLWDMSDTTYASDIIDWGEGTLHVLGNVEGSLVGVSDRYMEKSEGDDDLGIGKGAMVVKRWAGGIARVAKELVANQSVTYGRFIQDKVEKDNKLYWVASVPYSDSTSTENTYHMGIWCFGRKDANSDFALSLDYIEDVIDGNNFKINSFGNAGSYWFINHGADGSVEKTNDTATYTTSSIYETQKFTTGRNKGEFIGATILCETQPAAGQLVLKYRVDGGSWSAAILTDATDNIERTDVVNASAAIPQFKEIEFQITSTGGTVITGFNFRYEEVPDSKY